MTNNFKVHDLIADNVYISENNGNVVNTFGDQLIIGDKTFSGNSFMVSKTGDISIKTLGYGNLNIGGNHNNFIGCEGLQSFIGTNCGIVEFGTNSQTNFFGKDSNSNTYFSGDVVGLLNFDTKPKINGVDILLSGEIFLQDFVDITGDQEISGIKHFKTRVDINNSTNDGASWKSASGSYVELIDSTYTNYLYSDSYGCYIGGNELGIDANTIFNSTSITAPNQTITNSSSLLTKGLADSLYGNNYFSITTGLSSGVDNDIVGQKVHSLILPSGTWEFESYATLSGTVFTGSQGTRFYIYPNNTYSFYGQNSRSALINSFAIPQTSSIHLTNSNLPFSLYNIANNLISASHLKGTLIINQQTEISIFISQNIQQTGQPVYLLGGSYLNARKIK